MTAISSSQATEGYRKLCEHYSRGCSLVSPCCGKVYPCRFCHNENEPTHEFNRYAVSEVVCRKCNTRQPTVESCTNCGITFGQYFCRICRLYDDTDKGQYHCERCGLCRVGGKDNFFHCDKCGLCLPISMMSKHTCRAEASKSNCPICMEDIHTSRDPAHVPFCGHLLHQKCLKSLQEAQSFQCPLCLRSLFDVDWSKMDEDVLHTPLPHHLRDFMVQISCHDCQAKCNTAFHFIGYKCTGCGSYNTVRCGHEELPVDNNPLFPNQHLINEIINPLLDHPPQGIGNEFWGEIDGDDDDDDDDDDDGDEGDEGDYGLDEDDIRSNLSNDNYLSAEEGPEYHAGVVHGSGHLDTEDRASSSSWVTEEEEVIIGADSTSQKSNWTSEEEDSHRDGMPSV